MSKQILIIDDEDWYMEPILDRLDFLEISYEYVETIAEGLEMLEANTYKLIIMDMKLPFGKDFGVAAENYIAPGLFLLDEVRKRNKDIPVISYTALKDPNINAKLKNNNAYHIPKALEHPDTLFRKIEEFV